MEHFFLALINQHVAHSQIYYSTMTNGTVHAANPALKSNS
jgi:hypothetical protein